MKTCLLLRTKDKRKFLTEEGNLPSLIEYSKTFLAEIFRVEYQRGKILELKALALALCKQDYREPMQVRKIEKIYPKPKKSRQAILTNARKIQTFIRRRLLSGKPLSLKELKDKYSDMEVTDACLCNHLATVRNVLAEEGHQFRKTGAGTYCLADSTRR